MELVRAKVTKKGRVTIPKDVRDELGLEPGDRVWLQIQPHEDDREDAGDSWILSG